MESWIQRSVELQCQVAELLEKLEIRRIEERHREKIERERAQWVFLRHMSARHRRETWSTR
jgi:hypothetical protein